MLCSRIVCLLHAQLKASVIVVLEVCDSEILKDCDRWRLSDGGYDGLHDGASGTVAGDATASVFLGLSTRLGGTGADTLRDVATDAAGNLYVTGNASDNVFKVTPAGGVTVALAWGSTRAISAG